MRRAEMFVLPSELEGLPIALLEALGRGVPVVVSDIAPHRQIIGGDSDGARLVAVGDRAALAAAIRDALAHREPARQAAASRAAIIRQRYRWSDVGDKVAEVYQQVLTDRGARGTTVAPERSGAHAAPARTGS